MLEERTYFAMLHDRWIDERNWPVVRDAFFGDLPPTSRSRSATGSGPDRRTGPGRAHAEEMHALAVADIDAVAGWLGDQPFLMGAGPTKADATVHAFVCNLLAEPFATPLKDATKRHANLVAYNERMLKRFFAPQAAAA